MYEKAFMIIPTAATRHNKLVWNQRLYHTLATPRQHLYSERVRVLLLLQSLKFALDLGRKYERSCLMIDPWVFTTLSDIN